LNKDAIKMFCNRFSKSSVHSIRINLKWVKDLIQTTLIQHIWDLQINLIKTLMIIAIKIQLTLSQMFKPKNLFNKNLRAVYLKKLYSIQWVLNQQLDLQCSNKLTMISLKNHHIWKIILALDLINKYKNTDGHINTLQHEGAFNTYE
jgi:hypothetical protein